jgi:hypothetical protein
MSSIYWLALTRGNIKEIERELGLSYPTVRARLDGAIKELGFDAHLSNWTIKPGAAKSSPA